MPRKNLNFDKTNTLNSSSKTKFTRANSSSNTRVVGVKIDTKSTNTKDKIYYYRTNVDLKRGEQIRVRVPSGGTPISTVVVENSSKKKNIKNLIIEK